MSVPRRGVSGLAAGLVCAVVVSVVPGAEAAQQSTAAAAPQDFTRATSTVQTVAAAKGDLTSKVRGTFGKNGVVRGSFDPVRFIKRGDNVYGVGVLHARLTRGDGTLVGQATRQVTIPVKDASASSPMAARTCDILHLVLGPLDLNLLGLKVHLDKVVLDITAVTGAGNLLGNLLCAVVGLLDGPSTLTDLLRLANILDRILTLLKL